MIESILQTIGMLTIVLGLAALIVGAICRYEFISDLRYDQDALKERLDRICEFLNTLAHDKDILKERLSNIEGKLK